MEQRLIKIAKELNVGTGTIVEHLSKKGFDIENKPTAKVTDEMYAELLKEFQKSIAIKEQADQLVIGTRPMAVKKDPPPTPVFKEPAPKTTAAPPAEEKKPETQERPQIRLKIVDKIDLGSKLKPTKEDKPESAPEPEVQEKPETPAPPKPQEEKEPVTSKEPVVAETPEQKQEPREAKPAEPEKEKEKPAAQTETPEKPEEIPAPKKEEAAPVQKADIQAAQPESSGSDIIRAEAPELRGLKILGKIDTDKLKKTKKVKKKKEKEKEKVKPKETAPDAGASADKNKPKSGQADANKDDADKKKRRRKRKKVVASPNEASQNKGTDTRKKPGTGGRKENQAPEVSDKEIQEQIRATMARLSGGGKKKRQKLRRDNRERMRERQEMMDMESQSDKFQVTEFISVQELANLMDVGVSDVIMTCMNLGVIVSINQRLDAEIIELVASEFGHEVEFISAEEQIGLEEEEIEDDAEDLEPRAPIVTVMGHVDHGKTSLLDYIRSAKVVEGEAGGITQHIGAYEVSLEGGRKITFLDTPGHEAFTAMRARGAKVTDIAIIIVAADDSIMPQTKEAISHAEAAGVPIVFAINKIDKPGANPEKIKKDLASMNYLVEEWGGKYQSQDVSAKTGQGIEELLEKVLLEAELLELKANPQRRAIGTILEASLEKGRGYAAKILVQTGTLSIGDPMVVGEYAGRVKAMFNERNKRVDEAGPSTPVLVLGLDGAPQAGESLKVTETEQEARQIASKRAQIIREQSTRATKRISLDEIGRRLALGNFKELNLIVKGDVDGSVEALSDSLIKLSQETVQVNVIHKAVGQIVESDVLLASASDAIIVGFQVRPSSGARKLAEREGVEIKTYSIIYEAIEEIKLAIEGLLEPTKEEKIVGQAIVREVFKISKVGTVAGCYLDEGKLTRNTHIRIVRDGIVIFPTREGATGEISSLKRFKEDVREVKSGLECGITIKNFNDIKVGDVIEGFEIMEIKQKLN